MCSPGTATRGSASASRLRSTRNRFPATWPSQELTTEGGVYAMNSANMRHRKVLHVIETLGHGGAEHQLAVVATELDRQRYESVVCHLYAPDYLAESIRARGVPVYSLGLTRSKASLPIAIERVRRL